MKKRIRNWTEEEETLMMGKAYELQKKATTDGGKGTPKATVGQNEPRLNTASKVGKEFGKSASTVKRAAAVTAAVEKMKFTEGLKTLGAAEFLLRHWITELHSTVRACTAATFSDPRNGDDGVLEVIEEGLQEIRQATKRYVQVRRILRKRYDREIRKDKKADSLAHKRIAGIDFLFPNI
jgi:hypothetical protein